MDTLRQVSYDFFAYPAGSVFDADQALRLLDRLPDDGPLTPGGPMAAFLDALNGLSPMTSDTGWLAMRAEGADAGSVIVTTWTNPIGNLNKIADLARHYQLAVLDLQNNRQYDPIESVPMQITTDGGPEFSWVSDSALESILDAIEAGEFPWLTLGRADQLYAQTYRNDDGSWDVEFREGAPERHFHARTTDRTLVERFLWEWTLSRPGWRDLLPFKPMTF